MTSAMSSKLDINKQIFWSLIKIMFFKHQWFRLFTYMTNQLAIDGPPTANQMGKLLWEET